MFRQLLKNKKLILLLIVLLAGFLRFYQLGSIPFSLTWDEVAWGYNAYSLSIDGRDEFGKFLPYDYFISFGDYKPPVYAYLAAVPVMLFGPTEFAVRFPSALFGTITVLITYFLVKEIFKQMKTEYLALLSALVLAISPWHIMLSRAAFEANIATFFIGTGIWLFLFSLRKHPYLLVFSAISFVASLYTFNSARIVAPFIVLCLAIVFFKQLWKKKKYSIASLVVGVLLLLPIATFLISPEAKLRYAEVNIFSNLDIVLTANQEIANDHNAWWSKIIHNRRIAYSQEYIKHYFDHFNPRFLFINGDKNPKFSTQDVGQMYLWELPFLIIGVVFLIRKRQGYWWILPLWLLAGIIPAATARETPHALRIENTLPTWQILTAYGIVTTFVMLKGYQRLFASVTIAVALLFFVYFQHGYYAHYDKQYSVLWQDGYKQAIQYIKVNQERYDRIFVSDKIERGYVYSLFYLQYDPKRFREEVKKTTDNFGFVHVESFGKYSFAADVASLPTNKKKTLYIVGVEEVPSKSRVLQKFTALNGQEIVAAYTKE